jgi:hypothetical protein
MRIVLESYQRLNLYGAMVTEEQECLTYNNRRSCGGMQVDEKNIHGFQTTTLTLSKIYPQEYLFYVSRPMSAT